MSQTRYRLPDDLKTQCISLVRGYKRRVLQYHERRNKVIYSSPPPNIISEKRPDGKTIYDYGGRSSSTSDEVYSKAEALEHIETLFDTLAMKAVEQAKLQIGSDCNEEIRQRLMTAIWDSCLYGRNFNIEYYNLPLHKATFYRRRQEFLYNIALNLGLI